MDRQYIFNRVATHLLRQNRKSLDNTESGCAYRDQSGNMCAIGCLIPDDDYTLGLEGRSVNSLYVIEILKRSFNIVYEVTYSGYSSDPFATGGDANFLFDLQGVHDSNEVYEWRDVLHNVAMAYHLSADVLSTV